ncbi:MAG: hypothetical protein JWP01_3960 [Myxococcales bacterium]|nr:hypothetical protein [Myxococcales bacterium]
MVASGRKTDARWKERQAFRARIRTTVEALLLSAVIRTGSVRLPGGPGLLVSLTTDKQRAALKRLAREDIVRITFEFDVRSPVGAVTPGCRATNRQLRAKWTGPVSPHFALLAGVAQEFHTRGVLRSPDLFQALMSFVGDTTSTTPTEVPAVTFADLLGLEPTEEIGPTIRLPKPPHQVLAEGFRWARIAIESAAPELGDEETDRAIVDLDALARRVLVRCIEGRSAGHAHDVLQRVRIVLQPFGFSATDLDKITAAFSTAANLAPLKASTIKQYRVGARSHRRR